MISSSSPGLFIFASLPLLEYFLAPLTNVFVNPVWIVATQCCDLFSGATHFGDYWVVVVWFEHVTPVAFLYYLLRLLMDIFVHSLQIVPASAAISGRTRRNSAMIQSSSSIQSIFEFLCQLIRSAKYRAIETFSFAGRR
jgi:hypothetical protein